MIWTSDSGRQTPGCSFYFYFSLKVSFFFSLNLKKFLRNQARKLFFVYDDQGPLDQLKKAHMNSKKLKQQKQSWHVPTLCLLVIYYRFPLVYIHRTTACMKSGSLILVYSYGFFSVSRFTFSNFNVVIFILSYLLFFIFGCYHIEACSFLMKGRKRFWRWGD